MSTRIQTSCVIQTTLTSSRTLTSVEEDAVHEEAVHVQHQQLRVPVARRHERPKSLPPHGHDHTRQTAQSCQRTCPSHPATQQAAATDESGHPKDVSTFIMPPPHLDLPPERLDLLLRLVRGPCCDRLSILRVSTPLPHDLQIIDARLKHVSVQRVQRRPQMRRLKARRRSRDQSSSSPPQLTDKDQH